MTNMNLLVMEGYITKDAELIEKENGFCISSFTLAVNKDKKVNEQWTEKTNFFTMQILGKQAATLKPYLKKGTRIGIEGYLDDNRWEIDGKKCRKTDIKVQHVYFLSKSTTAVQAEEEQISETSTSSEPDRADISSAETFTEADSSSNFEDEIF